MIESHHDRLHERLARAFANGALAPPFQDAERDAEREYILARLIERERAAIDREAELADRPFLFRYFPAGMDWLKASVATVIGLPLVIIGFQMSQPTQFVITAPGFVILYIGILAPIIAEPTNKYLNAIRDHIAERWGQPWT